MPDIQPSPDLDADNAPSAEQILADAEKTVQLNRALRENTCGQLVAQAMQQTRCRIVPIVTHAPDVNNIYHTRVEVRFEAVD